MISMTKYWFIIHNLEAYRQHPDYIGQEKKRYREIEKVKKGDRIVYYATGDSVIVGTFNVVGRKEEWESDVHWRGPHICMKIKPRVVAEGPHFVPIKELVERIESPLSIFPNKKFMPIKFKDRTVVEINKGDFARIERFVKSYKPGINLFNGPANDGNLGEPMDLGVLNYAPTSEQGVVALFVHFMDKLKDHKFVKIEFIRDGFPDACVIEKEGNLYNRKYVEFEFKASKFREHVKNKNHRTIKCDYVVCWENDYYSCPIKVIELKSEIQKIMAK
jgi:hypothetical protein